MLDEDTLKQAFEVCQENNVVCESVSQAESLDDLSPADKKRFRIFVGAMLGLAAAIPAAMAVAGPLSP